MFRRKDTGRTDKYSDEDPLTDFKQYQKDDTAKTARKDMEDDGKIDKQKESVESIKQQIISHYQIFQETWIPSRIRRWELELQQLQAKFKDNFS